MTAATPDLAASAARAVTGRVPAEVRRFRTGTSHHVYEVLLRCGSPTSVVIRMGAPGQRAELAEGVRLNRLLRPLGIPLPAVLGEGLADPVPWLALERLPGSDLGDVIGVLPDAQVGALARGIAVAQASAALVGSAGRYGYAARPEAAPHSRWSSVLRDNLARSHGRIQAAGLFGLEAVERVVGMVESRRDELDGVPSIAFLHDTTMRNVIVTPAGTLSGIVDVDDLCWGDPRYVPALTLAVLQAQERAPSYVEHWMRAAGHSDDRLFRLYVALFLVDLMGEHGQRFNGNERPSTPRARQLLLQAFQEAADRAVS